MSQENMRYVKQVFEDIQKTSGLNHKKGIIAKNKNNVLFRKTLKFLLDSNVVTGISNKKMVKTVKPYPKERNPIYADKLQNPWENCMCYLDEHNTGSDADLSCIKGFLNEEPEGMRDFYCQLITKSFKLGCDVKVVNQVLSGLIPSFEVMLGTSIEKCKLCPGDWISISQKLNGNRCIFYKGELYTRQGKKYTGLDHILMDLKSLFNEDQFFDNVTVDGELIYQGSENISDSEAFQIGTGLANSKDKDKSSLKLIIFDILPNSEFDLKNSALSYRDRKRALEKVRDRIKALSLSHIGVVTMFYEGTDHAQIWKWLDYAEKHDMEGVMVNLDTPYQCKRTKNLIKVKKFFDLDLQCIGLEKGSGKYCNTLGYIICDYKGNELRCGSGFTDEQREFFWKNPSEIIDKIVTIKYKERTKNKNGGESLQFPVFIGVRFDKNTPDN